MNTYTKDYVKACRVSMEAQLDTYKEFRKTAEKDAGANNAALAAAIGAFEPLFFNNLVVVLDGFFVHRAKTKEGKDGNPLNEFRMICTSLLENGGVMCTNKTNNKTIKYDREKSVVKLNVGDHIKLTEPAFTALSKAFFAEVETKFT